jgi:hypothetical protein
MKDINMPILTKRAFISYSTEDKHVGAKIKQILSNFGIESFMAHDDINISEEWKVRILEELKRDDIFIPVLSDNFKNSNWCSQEAGIACFRDILIIPLSLDRVKPYGFMSHRQGKQINESNIPLNYLLEPIVNNFPELNIISKLIDKLELSNSYRNAEFNMANLIPYLDKLSQEEANRIVDISIANNQIWPADLCRNEYLPKIIDVVRNMIDANKLKELLKLIEMDI